MPNILRENRVKRSSKRANDFISSIGFDSPIAKPVTLAHHLQAYFDAIQRDVMRMMEAYDRVNRSPMGAAALAGTSVRVDREYVASLLGFEGIVENAMDSVSSRDFALESASVS